MTTRRKFFAEDGVFNLTDAQASMIFTLVMLGVVAGLISFVFSGSKAGQMQQALSTIPMQIQGLYSGSSSYSGLDNALAVKAGVVPKKLMNGDNIQTPWGGDITISATANGTFTIALEEVDEDDCTKLAVYQMDVWESVKVNTSSFDGLSTVSDIIGACGDSNTITYESR
ncbi:MAG: pilus assembly protein PilS [Deltaproteobacteria bacterium]|jgi:type II secretory pathway pseudopilin PulG|nr:pilus assembly protein PilS [Deltaproteobacteria bacterium]